MSFPGYHYLAIGPVWNSSTDEVVMTPTNNAVAVTIPSGCLGLEISNLDTTESAYLTPDNADLNSGREIPAGTSYFAAIQGSPTLYLATTSTTAVACNVVRYYGPA